MSFPFGGGFGKKLLDFVAIPGVLWVSGGWEFGNF